MNISNIHAELESYYLDTYCFYKGDILLVEMIEAPVPYEYDDDDVPIWEEDSEDLDIADVMHLFYADCSRISDGEPMHVNMSDLTFTFPDVGLINSEVEFQGHTFNVAKFVTRTAQRQWRRGLRRGALSSWIVPRSTVEDINIVTSDCCPGLGGSLRNNDIVSLYNPKYYDVVEAMFHLENNIGSYALSPNWWLASGTDSPLVFGYNDSAVGTVDVLTNEFKFYIPATDFLKESLVEVVGEEYYAA